MTRSWLIALSSLAALAAVALLGALYSTFSQPWPARATKLRAVTPPSSAATAPPEAASAASNLETARLDARRQAYAAIDALIQASELEQARKLLDEDDQRYGDDLAPEWHDLGQSYRLLADCLEHPSPKLRVRAEAFVLVSQAANLKSRILAACAKTPRR